MIIWSEWHFKSIPISIPVVGVSLAIFQEYRLSVCGARGGQIPLCIFPRLSLLMNSKVPEGRVHSTVSPASALLPGV